MELYEHNKRFFEQIKDAFERNQKVLFTTATGTGKSYVTKAYIDYKLNISNMSILIVVPKLSLLNEWKLLFKAYDSIEVITYNRFHRFDKEEIDNISKNHQLIVFDEAHAIGAKKRRKDIKYLYDCIDHNQSNVEILGLTATPIRGDGFDIIENFFDDIITGYGLQEAVDAKILNPYRYIIVSYRLKENIEKIKKEISGKKRFRAKDPIHNLIDKLDKKASEYNIRNIIISHLDLGKQNKIIVFVDHISSICNEQKMFKELFPEASQYIIHSKLNKNINSNNIEAFKNDSANLCFMFSVNMFNEGVHIPGVTGIIMLRLTDSLNVFTQQIGRVFEAYRSEESVIFDFVSNYSNLNISNLIRIIEEDECKNSGKTQSKRPSKEYQCISTSQETLEILEIIDDINNSLLNDKWTKEECGIIETHYPDYEKIYQLLSHRSKNAIKTKAIQLNLTHKEQFPELSEKQLELFKELYPNLGRYEIVDIIPELKNDNYAYKLALKLGLQYQLPWEDWEDDLIRAKYPKCGTDILELHDRRTQNSIKSRASYLKIKRSDKWTKEEDEIITKYYSTMKQKVSRLLPGRSEKSCIARAARLKLTGGPRKWTKEEDSIIIKMYPLIGRQVYKQLHNRSEEACIARAEYLKVKDLYKDNRKWTKEEESILKKYYPIIGTDVCSKLPNRTALACRKKAESLGIKRKQSSD